MPQHCRYAHCGSQCIGGKARQAWHVWHTTLYLVFHIRFINLAMGSGACVFSLLIWCRKPRGNVDIQFVEILVSSVAFYLDDPILQLLQVPHIRCYAAVRIIFSGGILFNSLSITSRISLCAEGIRYQIRLFLAVCRSTGSAWTLSHLD